MGRYTIHVPHVLPRVTMTNIRPIVLCILRRDEQILVFEGYDEVKRQTFYRPLGGGIDFGERSIDTVVREMKEELRAEVCNLRYLGTLENIFISNGQRGHEIVLVYQADFADSTFYAQESPEAYEDDGSPIKVLWKNPNVLTGSDTPLYPDGLLELLEG